MSTSYSMCTFAVYVLRVWFLWLCACLIGMVFDKKVFPTKNNNWVSLAHKPMISDSKELEKIFKPHKQVRLLNLPPPEKKTALKNKTGTSGMVLLHFYCLC